MYKRVCEYTRLRARGIAITHSCFSLENMFSFTPWVQRLAASPCKEPDVMPAPRLLEAPWSPVCSLCCGWTSAPQLHHAPLQPRTPTHQGSIPPGKSSTARESPSSPGLAWGRFSVTLPEQLEEFGVRGEASCFVLMGHQTPEHYSDISQQATPEHEPSSSGLACAYLHTPAWMYPLLTAWITSLQLPA